MIVYRIKSALHESQCVIANTMPEAAAAFEKHHSGEILEIEVLSYNPIIVDFDHDKQTTQPAPALTPGKRAEFTNNSKE